MRTLLAAVAIASAATYTPPAQAQICAMVVVVTNAGPRPAGTCQPYSGDVVCASDDERIRNVSVLVIVCAPLP